MTPILALDVGERRIGMATCGEARSIAAPLGAMRRKGLGPDVAAVIKAAQERQAGLILVGLPLLLDGAIGAQAQRTLDFCDALRLALAEAGLPLPVETWDERFSSVEAERLMREAGRRPSRDRARLDATAAAVILQSYLDAHRGEGGLP
ncbi:MAG: Holliday junction resolvase RuvX [Chloroflexi bacterium]|nr:Holliday junction resolvase RuvX [Chloroflexota bacterium]